MQDQGSQLHLTWRLFLLLGNWWLVQLLENFNDVFAQSNLLY